MKLEDKHDLLQEYQLQLMAQRGNKVPQNTRLIRKKIAVVKTSINNHTGK